MFDFINVGEDREIRLEIKILKIIVKLYELFILDVFLKFLEWEVLVFVIFFWNVKLERNDRVGIWRMRFVFYF